MTNHSALIAQIQRNAQTMQRMAAESEVKVPNEHEIELARWTLAGSLAITWLMLADMRHGDRA